MSVTIGALHVDPLTLDGALDRVTALFGHGGTVFTPNADHVVRAEHDAVFRAAYRSVTVSLADGMSVVWAARFMGTPLPAKVSGSQILAPLLVRAAQAKASVYFLGGRVGLREPLLRTLQRVAPGLQVTGMSAPTRQLQAPGAWDAVEQDLLRLRPTLVCVSLASPEQECWARQASLRHGSSVFICVGSAPDRLAGLIPAPPAWMSDAGFEWLFRLVHEPRRLARRYLVEDMAFFAIIARQRWGGAP